MPTGTREPTEQNEFIQRSKRGLLRIIFGRAMVVLVLLALQLFLMFAHLYDFFRDIPLLFGGIEAFTAVMLLYVLNTQENPSIKLSWSIIIAVLPLFGALLYFYVRFDLGHRVAQRLVGDSIRE